MASRLLSSGHEEVGIFHLVCFCQKNLRRKKAVENNNATYALFMLCHKNLEKLGADQRPSIASLMMAKHYSTHAKFADVTS